MTANWTLIRRILPLAAVIALMAAAQLTWFGHQRAYPNADAAEYVEIAQEVYLAFRDAGFTEGVRFAYLHRHWKPILSSQILAPFLAITSGEIRGAVQIYSALLMFAMVSGFFMAAKAAAGSNAAASSAALFIAAAPWNFPNLTSPTAEGPWLAAAAWFFYFLYRSEYLKRPRESAWAAVFLFLAAISRPETTLVLLPPFLFLLFAAVGGAGARILFSGFVILESGAGISLAFDAHFQMHAEYPPLTILFFAAVLAVYSALKIWVLFTRIPKAERPAHLIWTAVFAATFLWYLPAFENLLRWIEQCTSGALVLDTPNFALTKEFFPKLFLQRAGYILFFPLALTLFRPRWFQNLGAKPWAVHLWAAFALAGLGATTDSRDFRYYQVSWLALFLLSLLIFRNRKALTALLAVMATLQLAQFAAAIPGWQHLSELPLINRLLPIHGSNGQLAEPKSETQMDALADHLKSLPVPRDADAEIAECESLARKYDDVDQWSLTAAMRERGLYWDVGEVTPSGDIAAWILNESKNIEVLIVGTACPGENPGMMNSLIELLRGCAKQDCGFLGYRQNGRHHFPAMHGRPAEDYLIFTSTYEGKDLGTYTRFHQSNF